ncbi:MAG: 50S ribosomal protein L24 [Bacillales bacterium]|jgi:large subunit ribosomal protein L24|nr:50S ribosomal protein L24 [Bacillales bacterium]
MARIHKGDKVRVIAGAEKGKEGVVVKVLPKENRIVVEKVNVLKIHKKPSQNQTEGTILEQEGAIHISNVALIDPKAKAEKGKKKPTTKIGYRLDDKGKKVRFAKKSDTVLK